jgi:small subunit ribosomal protein S9
MTKSLSKITYTHAIGRRKSAIASIKLFSGKAGSMINGITLEKYFPGSNFEIRFQKPFVITDTLGKYYYSAKVSGGGKSGQLDALVLAISRALKKNDIAFGATLRNAGLMTVDSRVRQRRNIGTGGKARRQKQSPKR